MGFDIGSAVASVVGGTLGFLGQESANRSNETIANNQMDFQQKMSNTSYQRGMADMRAAGLNPMLGYIQGGASTPAGASTHVDSSLGAALQGASTGMNSAIAYKQMAKDMEAKDSNINLNNAMASKAAIDAATSASSGKNLEKQAAAIDATLEALRKEGAYRAQKAEQDRKFLKWDAIGNRLNRDAGTAKKVIDMVNPLNSVPSMPSKGYIDQDGAIQNFPR